ATRVVDRASPPTSINFIKIQSRMKLTIIEKLATLSGVFTFLNA
ncbi:unnamed protein product, partial [marine sediment metagenome]